MKLPKSNDQRGITHLAVAVVGVGVLIIAIFIGLTVAGKNHGKPSGNSSTANSGNIYAYCMSVYSDRRLCQFARNFTPLSKTSYTAAAVVTSPQGTVSNISLEGDGKGNTSLTGSANGQQISDIQLGGNIYVQTAGSNTWLEYKQGAVDAPAQTVPTANMNIDVSNRGLSFTYNDTETCGDLTCYKFLVTDKSSPNSTQYIWFDTGSNLLRQWSYVGVTGKTVMTFKYQAVSINAPSPVKVVTSIQ